MKNAPISPEFELLVRERLTTLADHAPTTVRSVVDAPDLALRPVDNPTPKRRIAGIGALVIALGGGFALTTIAATGGDGGGASTPEAAVEEFIGALEQRDVLGALDLLDPAESEVLVDVVRRAADEAVRIGLLSDDADLSDVAGTSFGVEGLVLTTETVAADLAVVHLSEGLVDLQFDMAALPFGDGLSSLTGDDGTTGESRNLADGNLQVATVQRNGRWYVSVGFSIAEAARGAAGVDYPVEPAAVPEGFGSPSAAATAFWERLAGFDIRSAVAMAAPGEGDAIARYAPLWLPSADRALADARASGTSITIGGLAYDVRGDGDHRQVTPTNYVIEGTLAPAPEYTDYPLFDPEAPTLVYSYISAGSGTFLVIPAGEPIPETFDIDVFVDEYPVELDEFQGQLNTAALNPNGTLEKYWIDDPTEVNEPAGPEPFRYELADGCTTMSGSAFDDSGAAGSLGYPGSAMEQVSDGVWRTCGESTPVQSVSALSVFLIRPGFGAAPQLPTIDVVEVDGQWYVSPIGTIFASVLNTFAAIPDGDVFSIDSAIAPFLYGTNRAGLEQSLIGLSEASIPPSCELVVVVDDTGTVTGLVDDVPTTGIQECFGFAMSGIGSSTTEGSVTVEYGPADTEVGVENTIAD